jgi:GTPase SAR1 family protein/polyhydroxyalkanoate synthesis regulator phasin
MSIERHIEHRAWAFQALDDLETFLNDLDFEGDVEEEKRVIGRKRKELKDGKYRVVILGEFNVGKSALVNAFLGGEYLPMVLEECTTKITHISKGDEMRVALDLSAPVSDAELRTLSNLLEALGVNATVSVSDAMDHVTVVFSTSQPPDLVRTLRPLVTMSADEDFPQLRTFRNKFDEIFIHLPTDLLEEDVALVDSPGVHSISETNTKIAEEIIPNSHLVICMLDSQNPGTEHNRAFIEKVVKHRHRKLFFVINKADQLNADEIDPRGRRGPAKDLVRSLRDIVDAPEIFFVSALYALVSSQLSRFHLMLPEIDNNNKIKIPWGLQRELMQGDEPTKGLAQYLMEQSNIGALKDRLLGYLYTENREGAILESICRFIDNKAWTYTRPIEVKLEMARDVPRLAELKAKRERISTEQEEIARQADTVGQDFKQMSLGGAVDGRDYAGYEVLLKERLTEAAVQQAILSPAREWLFKDVNFWTAKKGRFAPFGTEVDRLTDAFLQGVCEDLSVELDAVEAAVLKKMGKLCEQLDVVLREPLDAPRTRVGALRARIFASYVGFLLTGAILGAATGAASVVGGVFGQVPDVDAATHAGIAAGAAIGGVIGLLARTSTSRKVRRGKLMATVNQRVKQALLGGQAAQKGSVREQILAALDKRRTEFGDFLRRASENAIEALRSRIAEIEAEAEELTRRQQEIISRLGPKIEMLSGLGRKAVETADANAPREAGAAR